MEFGVPQGGTAWFPFPYVHSENTVGSCGSMIHWSLENTNKTGLYIWDNLITILTGINEEWMNEYMYEWMNGWVSE